MRRLPPRTSLPSATQGRLALKSREISAISDLAQKKKRARALFDQARTRRWFHPVVDALRQQSGTTEFCMYCSSNEPSQIEHFRPISLAPESALDFTNYLWVCDICNRKCKGERFPPHTEPGEQILNPIDDNVWDFFFLDEQHGRLIKRLDPIDDLPLRRAVSTCDVVQIDREPLQSKRMRRYTNLRRDVGRAVTEFNAGTITRLEICALISNWRTEPFQVDVADYFLNGPGRCREPFQSALAAAGETLP